MFLKRNSSMMLVGATALAALAACAPQQNSKPQAAATQVLPSADVPITDLEKAEIQAGLNKLGYDAGPVDGFVGRQTREAIRSFQADIGASVDGFYSPALLERVRAEAGEATIAAKPAAVQAPAAKKPVAAQPKPAAPKPEPVAATPAAPAPEPAPAASNTFTTDFGGDGGGGGGGGGGGDGGGGGW